jgi:CHAT domain-containing protein
MSTHCALAEDGRSLDELCADLMSKLTLCLHDCVARGAPMPTEVAEARRAELCQRGTPLNTDAHGWLDVSVELRHLSQLLLAPALPHLGTPGETLTIVPHLSIHGVPFCALPLPDGTPLVDAHPIAFAPSLTVMRQLLARADAADALNARDALVVGGARTAPSFGLPDIPHSECEARVVASTLGALGGMLVGEAAEARLLGDVLASHPLQFVHIACHARPNCLAVGTLTASSAQAAEEAEAEAEAKLAAINGAERGAALLYLSPRFAQGATEEAETEAKAAAEVAVLARECALNEEADACQQLGPIASGLVHMEVISQLGALHGHPSIFLSGSHTAGGQLSHDGVLGLGRSFLAVGARSVLACAWDAADEPSALLAQAYYKETQGTPARALRAAMRAVRTADAGRWDHPAFWSGWSLVGVS